MKSIKTEHSDVTLTLPGGTEDNDLPAQRVLVFNTDLGETEKDAKLAFESLWMPDEAEARRLEAGAAVILRITGQVHPPVSLSVSQAVVPERELVQRSTIDTAIGKLYADAKAWIEAAVEAGVDPVMPSDVFSQLWVDAMRAAQGVPAPEQNGTPPVRNTPDGTPERRACLEAGGHFWSGFDEERERSLPCERCGYDPGWRATSRRMGPMPEPREDAPSCGGCGAPKGAPCAETCEANR